jgi:hypothetical protein
MLLLLSCKDMLKKDEPPVAPEKMQKVLLDLHIAEVYSSMLTDSSHQSREKNPDSLAAFYSDVFTHHGVSKNDFDKGIEWYKAHPEEMDSLYNNIITEVGKLESVHVR